MSIASTCTCEPDLTATANVRGKALTDLAMYARECDYCGRTWASAYCVHDDRQEPCPGCDVQPVRQMPI